LRRLLIPLLFLSAVLAGAATRIVQDQCGPFTDVSPAICPYVLEMYYLGITAGTSPTTYSPDNPVTRGQAAVFVSKGVNQAIARSSRRAALQQWRTGDPFLLTNSMMNTSPLPTPLDDFEAMTCDGTDLWMAVSGSVDRVRASDGRPVETWTVAGTSTSVLWAVGKIFVGTIAPAGPGLPGSLFLLDPSQPAGAGTKVADLTNYPNALAFDGYAIWASADQSVSIISPGSAPPWPVTTVTAGFQRLTGLVNDGTNIWAVDDGACALLRLDVNAAITQTVSLGPAHCGLGPAIFDGANIVVSQLGVGVVAVHADDGAVVASQPVTSLDPGRLAFDGERILVVGRGSNQSYFPALAILRASDLTILSQWIYDPFNGPLLRGAASDGVSLFTTLYTAGAGSLARF
jgi:S-layer family protein